MHLATFNDMVKQDRSVYSFLFIYFSLYNLGFFEILFVRCNINRIFILLDFYFYFTLYIYIY